MTQLNLLTEAYNRVQEIAEATENCPQGKFTAIYKSDSGGITVSHIQIGWDTRPASIGFGSEPKTKTEIINILDREKSSY